MIDFKNAIVILIIIALIPSCTTSGISATQKKDFIDFLSTLPHDSEFYPDESIKKAAKYIDVLFSLTDKDIDYNALYPYIALSVGLSKHEKYRKYGAQHFSEISHPDLKLFWGSVLFSVGPVTPEIVDYLKAVLKSEEQTSALRLMIGPNFEKFRRQVATFEFKAK